MYALLLALFFGVVVGVAVHEIVHAFALRTFGVPCSVALPTEGTSSVGLPIGGAIATVTIDELPADVEPWQLRVAAMMPLVLAIPFFVVAVGAGPSTSGVTSSVPGMIAVGMLGCAIPSPADFAIAWRPESVLISARND